MMAREENTNQQNQTIPSSQRQPKSGVPKTNLSFFPSTINSSVMRLGKTTAIARQFSSRHVDFVNSWSCIRHFYCSTRGLSSTSPTHFRQQYRNMSRAYPSQLEAMKDHVANLHTTHPHLRDTPIHTPADDIQQALIADGHRIWGFIVYRCTYDSDAHWQLCMQRIHDSLGPSIKTSDGQDLLNERFKLTVMEDEDKFDGASTSTVRQHFRDWCVHAVNEEQRSNDEIERRRQEPVPWCGSLAVRYRFCLQIDAASLKSIVEDEPDAWINLIRDDWRLKQAMAGQFGDDLNWDQGDLTDDEDEAYPAIEGNTNEDVGWMMVDYRCLIPTYYSYLRDPNDWNFTYARPPYVVFV
jgi:hypothetical protein